MFLTPMTFTWHTFCHNFVNKKMIEMLFIANYLTLVLLPKNLLELFSHIVKLIQKLQNLRMMSVNLLAFLKSS